MDTSATTQPRLTSCPVDPHTQEATQGNLVLTRPSHEGAQYQHRPSRGHPDPAASRLPEARYPLSPLPHRLPVSESWPLPAALENRLPTPPQYRTESSPACLGAPGRQHRPLTSSGPAATRPPAAPGRTEATPRGARRGPGDVTGARNEPTSSQPRAAASTPNFRFLRRAERSRVTSFPLTQSLGRARGRGFGCQGAAARGVTSRWRQQGEVGRHRRRHRRRHGERHRGGASGRGGRGRGSVAAAPHHSAAPFRSAAVEAVPAGTTAAGSLQGPLRTPLRAPLRAPLRTPLSVPFRGCAPLSAPLRGCAPHPVRGLPSRLFCERLREAQSAGILNCC